jgi:hypothetical protein
MAIDLRDSELPEACLPACCLLQECWEAAGLSTEAPAWHPPESGDGEPAQSG